jgi:Protein of unknown function (DUF3761)
VADIGLPLGGPYFVLAMLFGSFNQGATPDPGSGPASSVATALCVDGTYSYAASHQGACSHHGGVSVFYR